MISERRPWREALVWLALLGVFFFLSYGFATWATGLRHSVPSLAFGWEHRIPFLVWTIVPYWSTDLFYAGALFLCTTKAELRTLVKRLLTVQVLCVAGFLLFPLRFSFERPPVGGLFGVMFDALESFDKPFNQAPSLHVALTAVLWVTYSRHLGGWVLWIVRVWFVAMALSTLTTWQHHFIDLPIGLWVGLLSIVLLPDLKPPFARSKDARRLPIGAIYLAGAAICAVGAFRIGWLLLWPAGSLAAVAGIYWTGRALAFGKSAAGLAVFGPYVAGAWLNSRLQTRNEPRAQEIVDGVWLGRMPRRAGFKSVVDLTAELPFTAEGVVYRSVPMLDLLTPGKDQLEAAVQAIDELSSERPTLVFCALGYSRSAAAVAAWLLASGNAKTMAEAIARVRARRPQIVLR